MTDVALWFPLLRLDTNITAKLGYHKKSDKQTHFHLLSPLTDLSTYWSNYAAPFYNEIQLNFHSFLAIFEWW